MAPRGVGIRPGIHAEGPCAGSVGGHPGFVAVQAGRDVDHAGTGVFTSVRAQQDGFGGECVVSFAEHGCTDGERLAFGRLSGKRSVFDDGEHFDDRDTGQQFLAHIPHPNVWTDQLIGEDHTTECDRSPMPGKGRPKSQRREQTAGVASEQLGCHPRLSTCDAESVSAIDSGEDCNAEDDVQQDRRDQADDLPG